MKDRLHVDVEAAIVVDLRHVQQRRVAVAVAGVVHQDVELSELRGGGIDHARHVVAPGDVGFDGNGVASDLFQNGFGSGAVDVRDHDLCPFDGEAPGDPRAESRAAARDNCHLIG